GEQHVLGESALDVAPAIAPRPELLDDPGGQTHRRVAEPVGQRLRLRALDLHVARLLAHPVRQLLDVLLFLVGGRGWWCLVTSYGEQVDVDAGHAIGIRRAQARGDERAPVAALRGEAP